MTASPHVGELFADRYRIEETLGEGGMGAVYRALDEKVGDVVALKTLIPHGPRAEAAERFRREVRLARRITHPNVARIHDLGEHEGTLYLTMEYVHGRDLSQIADDQSPLSPRRAAALLLPVAEALSAIHRAGIVHRDLKPANVLVEEGGRVVLADFGIARAEADEAGSFRTAGPIGTPLYMAPEQITGAGVSAQSDLYALGLMLYELLTGELPFLGPTPMATAIARLHEPVPDPRSVIAVPDDLATLTVACLSREPAGRPKSAEEVAARLREAAETGATSRSASLAMQATAMMPSLPPARSDTVSPGDRALAVLPFRYRGASDHDYLGDALTDELIDLLSTTRGLRVLSSGATERFREERDPKTVGSALEVDAVVDGTVQASGDRLRVAARLCDARSGVQLWSERFESDMEDVFELQDRLGRRIAESLRVGLSTTTHRGDMPAEAIQVYLQARKKLRAWDLSLVGPDGGLALLERCIELAPDFGPALAGHAMASVRAWFVPGLDESRDWERLARESTARALERAPDIAETQLAAATLASHDGDFGGAARRAERALAIAPTYADAHEYLGRLQCEAGRPEEGLRRLRLALDLDPSLGSASMDIARVEWLLGRREESEAALRAFTTKLSPDHPAAVALRVRMAAWEGDLDAIRAMIPTIESPGYPMTHMMASYARTVVGLIEPAQAAEMIHRVVASVGNRRFQAVSHQMSTEAFGTVGAVDLARAALADAVDAGLIDILWVERCPALDRLRGTPEFDAVRSTVHARARDVWTGT